MTNIQNIADDGQNSNYSVKVSIPNPDDCLYLNSGKFKLVAFKAVDVTEGGGAPTVWFKSKAIITQDMTIKWTEQYEAYMSTYEELNSGVTLKGVTATQIDRGEEATIQPDYTLLKGAWAKGDSIAIHDKSDTKFIVGIRQASQDGNAVKDGNESGPMCAIPIARGEVINFTPKLKVIVTFANEEIDLGTVLTQSAFYAAVIDLTHWDPSSPPLTVQFDLKEGWSGIDDTGWFSGIDADDILTTLLITTPPPTA